MEPGTTLRAKGDPMPEILTEIRDAKQAMKDVEQRIGCLRDELMASIQQSLVEYNELCDTRLELREADPLPEKRKVGRPKGSGVRSKVDPAVLAKLKVLVGADSPILPGVGA